MIRSLMWLAVTGASRLGAIKARATSQGVRAQKFKEDAEVQDTLEALAVRPPLSYLFAE